MDENTTQQNAMEQGLSMATTLRSIAEVSEEADIVRMAVGALAHNGFHFMLDDLAEGTIAG